MTLECMAVRKYDLKSWFKEKFNCVSGTHIPEKPLTSKAWEIMIWLWSPKGQSRCVF